jgi:hypothetical protein
MTSSAIWAARVLGLAACGVIVAIGLAPGFAGLVTHPEPRRPIAFVATMIVLTTATVGYLLTWIAQRIGAVVILAAAGALALVALFFQPARYAWLGPVVVQVPVLVAAMLILSGVLYLYAEPNRPARVEDEPTERLHV